MDGLDPLLLARIQFAFTVSFHILFPSLTIGLGSYLVVLQALWMKTGNDDYRRLHIFWTKVFAVSFGMGVVSGIVLSYQFGTNWSRFSDVAGPVVGPLIGYEVLTAFFLEATFLGIMLFGWNRVNPKFHFFSTCTVAVGTLISAFWILSANSWMQTPVGYEVVDGAYHPKDWLEIIFNPSFPYRFVHMVIAAYLTTAFTVGAVGAYHLLKDNKNKPARIMFSMAMWMATIVAPIQLVAGDLHGLNTLEHQPMKVAAMEGHWETRAGQPLILFGIPDEEAEETRAQIAIPKLGSFVLKHDWNAEVKGLKEVAPGDRPPVAIVFWSFRVMVGLGILMILTGLVAVLLRLRQKLYDARWFHRFCLPMGLSGYVAILAGWFVTEVGRQPWLVYGLLRTENASSPVDPGALVTMFIIIAAVYVFAFGMGTYYLIKVIRQGPETGTTEPPERGSARRPISAAG